MDDIIKWKELARLQRDALVAEHIMGLKIKHYPKFNGEYVIIGEQYLILDVANRPIGNVPPYTKDMNLAWGVLEILADDEDYDVRRRFLHAWREHVNCGEDEWKKHNGYSDFISLDDIKHVTPDRICIAALRAKGLIIIEDTELETQETTEP